MCSFNYNIFEIGICLLVDGIPVNRQPILYNIRRKKKKLNLIINDVLDFMKYSQGKRELFFFLEKIEDRWLPEKHFHVSDQNPSQNKMLNNRSTYYLID